MKLYSLPNALRTMLAHLHVYAANAVHLISGPREYIGLRLRGELYPYLTRIAVVGDIVCSTFIKFVGVPRMCIVDGKTLRKEHRYMDEFIAAFTDIHRCRNPPGTISSECLDIITNIKNDLVRHLIIVDGEEDLLALAVALTSRSIDYIIYGVPQEGVAIIDTERFTITAINLFSQFRHTSVDI